jgi:glutathione S-transferase
MKLYYHPLSPYSQKALVALFEANAPFEPVVTNLFDPAVRASYKAEVNPLVKIPFLMRDNGWAVPESSIILEYIDQYFPTEQSLIPTDRDKARQARFYDRLGDLYLIEKGSILWFESMKPEAARNGELIERTLEQGKTALGLFDKELRNKEFLLADRFTMADISPAIGTAGLVNAGVDLAPYPNVAAWYARIWARPSFQRVGAEIGAALAAMAAAAKTGEVSEG